MLSTICDAFIFPLRMVQIEKREEKRERCGMLGENGLS